MSSAISASTYTQQTGTGDTVTYNTVAKTEKSGAVVKTTHVVKDQPAAATAAAATVKLSQAAQEKLLQQQGEDAKQIAANIGTTEKQVEEDLGETETAALAAAVSSLSGA